jgi:phosphotransferase system HPr (HPr) family protein
VAPHGRAVAGHFGERTPYGLGSLILHQYLAAAQLDQAPEAAPLFCFVTTVVLGDPHYGLQNDRHKALVAGCHHRFVKTLDPSILVTLLSASNTEPDSPLHNGPPPETMSDEDCPMFTHHRQVEIINDQSFHLRVADKCMRMAQQFHAGVQLTCDNCKVDGRIILDLMTRSAGHGSRLELETYEPDASAAMDALTGLIERGFDEHRPESG